MYGLGEKLPFITFKEFTFGFIMLTDPVLLNIPPLVLGNADQSLAPLKLGNFGVSYQSMSNR